MKQGGWWEDGEDLKGKTHGRHKMATKTGSEKSLTNGQGQGGKEATLTAQMDFYFDLVTFYEYDLSHLIPNRLSQPEQNSQI